MKKAIPYLLRFILIAAILTFIIINSDSCNKNNEPEGWVKVTQH